MSKDNLLVQINDLQRTISEEQDELKLLKEKMEVLLEFSETCDSHIVSFDASIQRRKGKLSTVDNLVERVKSVKEYRQAMGTILTGADYTSTVSSIDAIQISVSTLMNDVKNEILDTEERIKYLNNRLKQLQYEYDNYQEEVTDNGGL